MFEVEAIDHVAVVVQDVARAVAWYQAIFGMTRRYADVWSGPGDPVLLCRGIVCIALLQPRPDDAPLLNRRPHVAIRVDDLNFERAQQALREHGIDYRTDDHTVTHSIYFFDPDGNQIEVTTYVHPPRAHDAAAG